eukprot:PhF_6_TR15958/c0_g1_i1/m.24871
MWKLSMAAKKEICSNCRSETLIWLTSSTLTLSSQSVETHLAWSRTLQICSTTLPSLLKTNPHAQCPKCSVGTTSTQPARTSCTAVLRVTTTSTLMRKQHGAPHARHVKPVPVMVQTLDTWRR